MTLTNKNLKNDWLASLAFYRSNQICIQQGEIGARDSIDTRIPYMERILLAL